MHVIVDGVTRRFLRRLKQRAHIHVKTDIGKGRGDHLGAAVVAVLAHLDHQHARPAAFFAGEILDLLLNRGEIGVALIGRAIHPAERAHLGLVAAKCLFHRH